MRNKVYADKAGRGTMIVAIIAAYDNNDSGTRYTSGHRGVIEKEGAGGGPRKDGEEQINGGEKRVPAAAAS